MYVNCFVGLRVQVLGAIPGSGNKVLLRFFNRNFSVTVSHLQSYQVAVLSEYVSDGRGNAPVHAHTLVYIYVN